MNHDTFDSNLLARYLAGECPAAEAEAVRRWIDQDPQRRDEAELLECVWDVAAGLPSAATLTAMWNEVAGALNLEAACRAPSDGGTGPFVADAAALPGSRWRRWPLAMAAALTLVAGGMATAWWLRSEAPATSVSRSGPAQEFQTVRGQRAMIRLLDGTGVVLGPESRLRIWIAEAGPRELVLSGEALFEVVHDPARPFIVRAGRAVTEDLGTTFGVRAYHGEAIRVVVREGAVAMRDTTGASGVMLVPRDLARMQMDGRISIERGVDPEQYLAWTAGRLVFQRTPFADVSTQLERWFDIRVMVADSALRNARVTAAFDNDDLDEVLRVLSEALNASVERRGRWVYVRDRR